MKKYIKTIENKLLKTKSKKCFLATLKKIPYCYEKKYPETNE